jgi:hypothetical protein
MVINLKMKAKKAIGDQGKTLITKRAIAGPFLCCGGILILTLIEL